VGGCRPEVDYDVWSVSLFGIEKVKRMLKYRPIEYEVVRQFAGSHEGDFSAGANCRFGDLFVLG
jgi:hypothetical protein